MNKKLLFLIFIAFTVFTSNAQSISIVGEAVGGWPDDDPSTPDTHIMSTTDNQNYTISNLIVTTAVSGGGAKFRQDGAWTLNWGNSAFPNGVATQNGSNILTVAGTYDVTFNRITGAYTFTNVAAFPNIGIVGTVNGVDGFNLPDVDMTTFDGITYTLKNHTFLAGEAKFRQDDAWATSWGSTAFPSGTANLGGANIPVPAGIYTVTFNIQTGAYSFEYPKIGILGTAVSADGFSGPDIDLTTTDGVHYKLINHVFTDGAAKFRQDDAWDVNWGSNNFPSGTGTLNGNDIPVTANTYTVNFNRVTGEYSFDAPIVFQNIGIIGTAVLQTGFDGDDIDMTTTDGITYTLQNHVFTNGEAKFRLADAWDTSWGGTNFPAATASISGANIPVTAGTYTVTFNVNTLAYSFVGLPEFPTVGILGTGVNGSFDGPDINMTTTDGVTYTLMNHTFTTGFAKFRQDDAWSLNWGSTDFPSGTGNLDGQNIPVLAGIFNVTFNRITQEYNFSIVGEFPSVGILGTAVSGDGGFGNPDVDMATTNGIVYTLNDLTLLAGELKFRQNDSWDLSWGGSAFPDGTAVENGDNIVATAGTYNVTFNRLTLAYSFSGDSFADIALVGDAVGSWDNGAFLITTDGINYTKDALELFEGDAKFRQGNDWNGNNWGSFAFPTGTGTHNGDNIPVLANRYNVVFNNQSGDYAFNFVRIGILGTAVNSFDVADTDLTTVDGINYSITLTLNPGEFKLRENDNWTVNWGGDNFPTDTYIQGGNNIAVSEAGEYSITFNRITGEFTATFLSVNEIQSNSFKVYPNPSNTVWNFNSSINEIKSVQIIDVLGKVILIKNTSGLEAKIDASSLPNGMYFARISTEKANQTIKVIKN